MQQKGPVENPAKDRSVQTIARHIWRGITTTSTPSKSITLRIEECINEQLKSSSQIITDSIDSQMFDLAGRKPMKVRTPPWALKNQPSICSNDDTISLNKYLKKHANIQNVLCEHIRSRLKNLGPQALLEPCGEPKNMETFLKESGCEKEDGTYSKDALVDTYENGYRELLVNLLTTATCFSEFIAIVLSTAKNEEALAKPLGGGKIDTIRLGDEDFALRYTGGFLFLKGEEETTIQASCFIQLGRLDRAPTITVTELN